MLCDTGHWGPSRWVWPEAQSRQPIDCGSKQKFNRKLFMREVHFLPRTSAKCLYEVPKIVALQCRSKHADSILDARSLVGGQSDTGGREISIGEIIV